VFEKPCISERVDVVPFTAGRRDVNNYAVKIQIEKHCISDGFDVVPFTAVHLWQGC